VSEPALLPTGAAKVLFIKFNDYQCPACLSRRTCCTTDCSRSTKSKYPGVFVFQTRDLPLETECGLHLNHMLACEAAAAVRMAKRRTRGPKWRPGCFNNQSFEMTRDDLKRGLRDVAQVTNFDEQYSEMLPAGARGRSARAEAWRDGNADVLLSTASR
jgi:hypothetical protein